MQERLQKIISAAGIASRRSAEELMLEGRVRVNGKVVNELGSRADAEKDHIKVDGKLINPRQPKAYLMLNKPVGYVTTLSDPEGRQTVQDLLKGVKVRVYPVGRLDYNTEGLLLLTNDGDFAHLVMHPRHELPKTYLVKIKGVLDDEAAHKLESGVYLKDGKTAPARVRRLRKEEANSWVEITIHEGKKRQVRRMIDHVGNSVIRLKRVRAGNLPLGNLPPGAYRHLTPDEVRSLREMAEGKLRETIQEETAARREAEGERRKARGARDERRAVKSRVEDVKVREGVRGKAREAKEEARWMSNRPFGMKREAKVRSGTSGISRGIVRQAGGPGERDRRPAATWPKRESGRHERPRTTSAAGARQDAPAGVGRRKLQGREKSSEVRWTSNRPLADRERPNGNRWRKTGTGGHPSKGRRKGPAKRPLRPRRPSQ